MDQQIIIESLLAVLLNGIVFSFMAAIFIDSVVLLSFFGNITTNGQKGFMKVAVVVTGIYTVFAIYMIAMNGGVMPTFTIA